MPAIPSRLRLHALAAAALALSSPLAGAQAQAQAQQRVEVIGTSPLPGQGVPRELLPYTTQVVRRAGLEQAQADHATDFMARRLPGVQVNDIQGSPFQGDLTFRGYRASGILGASQGLSVYIDGVRVNEPFGDVVNWDMVPEFAIDSLSLVPGANPAFGLNSLGGALAFTTASGRSAPGLRGEVSAGSFGRHSLSLSHGAVHASGLSHYLGLGLFEEDGWRDHSAGRVGNLVAKLGHSSELGDLSLNLLAGRSTLVGNGLVPLYTFDDDGARTPDLGAGRRQAVYTHPDETRNRVTQASLQWRRALGDTGTLEALAYARNSRRSTVNGDEAEEADEEAVTGESLRGTGPRARTLAFAPEGAPENAAFNRTSTRQRSSGLALAWSQRSAAHQWQLGASIDMATVRYVQTEQDGSFDATRGVLPFEGDEAELSARVRGSSRLFGLYATDTWRVAPATHVTGTLRYNEARVSNTLTTRDDDTDELEAKPREAFTYRSWNPALGVAHQLGGGAGAGLTLFANLARNNRVPTVIELGCADPDEPCRLPAGLQADPYLKQVVSTTLEAGLRFGGNGSPWRGSVALYRTHNRDDILFRSTSVVGQLGYFENFARTRHQGLDAELATRFGPVDLGLTYSHLDATYQAGGTLRMGERNVTIRPGTRIAGLPRHQLKLSADWAAGGGFSLGGDVQALSGRGVAGNEDGLMADQGARVDFGLPGYAIVNLRASWKPAAAQGLEVYARVSNAFNRRYASFGAVAETVFDAQGSLSGDEADAVFVAPGAPRAFTLGLRYSF